MAPQATLTQTPKNSPARYGSNQDVRWCPGCGDYSVLAQIKKALAAIDADPDNLVFISGIGCSSRLPYYMGSYGIHGIHGRAPAIATGLKIARPELEVWIATGDGDGLSIGGNHLVHAIRRNINARIILFNNRIYGLTKGQIAPTSEPGKRTVSTPFGSLGGQIGPSSFAIGCEASFVARTIDMYPQHLQATLERAAAHHGLAFVEVYQNCNVFNDGAFKYATDKILRADNIIELQHGKPLIFGAQQNKGIRLASGYRPEVVTLGEDGVSVSDLLVHDEKAPTPFLAFLLTRLRYPEFPEAVGVFRDVEATSYDTLLNQQVERVGSEMGGPDLQKLLSGSDTWTVQ